MYFADTVPVGEDQLPHLELTREIARRFNFLYKTDLFPEPQALLGKFPLVPGVDGRKMSKSYGNDIAISATSEEVRKRVNAMVTDPGRVRREDLGNPDVCIVNKYHEIYNNELLGYIQKTCRAAERGCVNCKKELYEIVEKLLAPVRERRALYENNTYELQREYLVKLKNKKPRITTEAKDEAPVHRKFDQYWKKAGRREKEKLKKTGSQVIADYKAGLITLNDVQSLLDAKFDFVNLILQKGAQRARRQAADTIEQVRAAMNLRY